MPKKVAAPREVAPEQKRSEMTNDQLTNLVWQLRLDANIEQ